MIPTAELVWQRRNTQAFIDADWVTITLLRAEWSSDGAGGSVKGDSVPLTPQRMRLIPSQDGATLRTTANGEEVAPDYTLMGLWDADIERWDEFTLNGMRYEIVFVNQNTQYETKGEVAYLGSV